MKRNVVFVSFILAVALVLSGCGGNNQCGIGPGGQVIVCQPDAQQAAATLTQGIVNAATALVITPESYPMGTPMPTNSGYSPLPAETQVEIYPLQTQVPPNEGYDAAPTREYAIIEDHEIEVRVVEDVDSTDGLMPIEITTYEGVVFTMLVPDGCDLESVKENSLALTDGAKFIIPGNFEFERTFQTVTTASGVQYQVKLIDIGQVQTNVLAVQSSNGGMIAYYKISRSGTATGGIEIRKVDLATAIDLAQRANKVADLIAEALNSQGFNTSANQLKVTLHGSVAQGYSDYLSDLDVVVTYQVDSPILPLYQVVGMLTSQSSSITAPLANSGLSDVNILLFRTIGTDLGDPAYISLPIPGVLH